MTRAETTHVYDVERGGMRQIVPPWRLRQILRAQGESLSRPKDFGPNDEWNTKETR